MKKFMFGWIVGLIMTLIAITCILEVMKRECEGGIGVEECIVVLKSGGGGS